MLTREQSDIASRRQTVPPAAPAAGSNRDFQSSHREQPERRESPEPAPLSSHAQPASGEREMTPPHVQEASRSSFGLEEIRTIAFRCGQCRTVVRFPRIRWTSFPESCPNCRTRWMTPPTVQSSWQEDTSTYVFRVMLAFREALQALVSIEGTAVFRLALEMGEYPNDGNAAPVATGRNGNSRG